MDGLTLNMLREPCDECPFKGRFDLRAGRLKDIIEQTENDDAAFACHKTCDRGSSVSHHAFVCAGWLEAARARNKLPTIVQIAERLGLISWS